MGISLGSTDYLKLAHVETSEKWLLELQDCSCYVLGGEARDRWKHGLGRIRQGQRFKEESFERISLTVRHVIESRRKVPA